MWGWTSVANLSFGTSIVSIIWNPLHDYLTDTTIKLLIILDTNEVLIAERSLDPTVCHCFLCSELMTSDDIFLNT